jgi:outer membrane protein OmpA-like peptidoglycan-associated protein
MKFKATSIKLFLSISLIILQGFSLNAQQRKGNGDKTKAFLNFTFEVFEDETTISEPMQISMLKNVGSPTEIGADIFNTNSPGEFCTGQNMYGKEEPIAASSERLSETDKNLFDPKQIGGGNGYAGIVTYKPGKLSKERSYITIPFMGAKGQVKMIKGMKYCVEFSVSLGESSKYASNNIQMMFSPKDYINQAEPGAGIIAREAGRTLSNYKNKVYSGFFGWEKVCAMYEAKGDEICVIIGNFEMNDQTKVEVQKKPKDSENEVIAHSYYFIDNVRIKEVKSKEECNCYAADTADVAEVYSTLIYDKTPILTDKMTIDQKIKEQVAYFGFGKKSYTPSGKEAFNYIIAAMNENSSMRIKITGHNDKKEDEVAEQNQELINMARQRAEAIKNYFVKQGITEDRIDVDSSGSTISSLEIQSDDDNEVRDAKNRRVMFEVVE